MAVELRDGADVQTQIQKSELNSIVQRIVQDAGGGRWVSVNPAFAGWRDHGKNILVWYAVSCQDSRGAERQEEIAVKLYRKHPDLALSTYLGMRGLWEGDFGRSSNFRVARAYGFYPEMSAVVMQKVTGVPWREMMFRGGDELRTSSVRAADWLRRFHDCGMLFRKVDVQVTIANLWRQTAALQERVPHLVDRTHTIANRIASALPYPGPFKPSHGDFRNAHVFLNDGATAVIDFDGLALREPAVDLGHATAHLLIESWFKTGSFDTGAQAAGAFLRRYMSHGAVDISRVRLNIALALFRKAPYKMAKRDPSEAAVAPWLDLVERFLDDNSDMPLLGV